MDNKDINNIKHPVVIIDKSLDEEYNGKVIFKEKLDEANRMLTTYGVPKSAQNADQKDSSIKNEETE
jgi:hypothetical protein